MRPIATSPGSRLVPALRYRDVASAVEWLCGAFGFQRHDVVTAVDGTILHARLMFGSDIILLLPVRSPDLGLARPPEEIGMEMQSCYFVVDDADQHYHHAKASGAEILDITEYDYGGRGYSCRDPEGHIWNFGTYDPRRGHGQALTVVEHWPKPPPQWQTALNNLRLRTVAGLRSVGDKINPPVVVAAVVAAVIAAATVGWMLVALPQNTAGGADKRQTQRSIAPSQFQRPEEVAQQPAQRTGVNTLSIRPATPQQSDDAFERAARQAPPPAPAPPQASGSAFGTFGTVVDTSHDRAAKEAAAEEALRQLRAAQRTAGEAFKQLRETGAEAAAAAPAEPRKQVAKAAAPDPREIQWAREQLAREQAAREQQMAREQQIAREQQQAREQAAKQSAAVIEAQERAAREAAERAKVTAIAPPKEAPRPAPEQKTDTNFWDCQPSATGEVVCNPARKPAVPEAKAAAVPKPKMTVAEPVPAPAPAVAPAHKASDTRTWDCQPKATTGEVVCRPVGAKQ